MEWVRHWGRNNTKFLQCKPVRHIASSSHFREILDKLRGRTALPRWVRGPGENFLKAEKKCLRNANWLWTRIWKQFFKMQIKFLFLGFGWQTPQFTEQLSKHDETFIVFSSVGRWGKAWTPPPPPRNRKNCLEVWCYLPEVYSCGAEPETQERLSKKLWKRQFSIVLVYLSYFLSFFDKFLN